MKLSLLFEASSANDPDPEAERRVFSEALDQAELADTLGFHTLWAVEHHFLEQYAHSSAPEVFLAAASQRTKKMRLGHGIMHLVPKINHPFRAAERIATLDHLSGGRVDFGSGEGSSLAELGGFGIDIETKRAAWEESLQVAIEAMTQTPFPGIDGEFVSAPARNVVPKPYQRPHPPLWMAASNHPKLRDVARRGMGALGFLFVDMGVAKEWVEDYYRTFEEEAIPIGLAANPNVVLNTPMACAPTRALAQERFGEANDFFNYGARHYYQNGQHFPGKTNILEEFNAARPAEQPELQGGPIGTPEDVLEVLMAYAEAGVDQILMMNPAGYQAKHEDTMESLELLGKHVIPELEKHHQAGEEKRAKFKAEISQKAMDRKGHVEPRKAPEGYFFGVVKTGMSEGMDELYAAATGEGTETRPSDVK